MSGAGGLRRLSVCAGRAAGGLDAGL